jgi:hypothetical protein
VETGRRAVRRERRKRGKIVVEKMLKMLPWYLGQEYLKDKKLTTLIAGISEGLLITIAVTYRCKYTYTSSFFSKYESILAA